MNHSIANVELTVSNANRKLILLNFFPFSTNNLQIDTGLRTVSRAHLFVMVNQIARMAMMRNNVLLPNSLRITGMNTSRWFPHYSELITIAFHSNKYYRVIERSNGEWQTKCIDKELGYNMNKYELSEVCRHFGFNLTKGIDHRLLDSITNQTHIQRNYQRNAIKMLPNIPKSTLKLNDNFNLTLFAPTHNPKPVKWDKIDEAKCYQLEVYCKN